MMRWPRRWESGSGIGDRTLEVLPARSRYRAHTRMSDPRSPIPNPSSEREPETELPHPRRVLDRAVEGWLPVVPVALLRHVRSVVGVVEHVVSLDEAVDRHPAAEVEPPLQPEVDTMDRI